MTDEQIIALYWHRSEEAISQTDASYGRKLRGLSQRILGNPEDASEVVNDTYMKTWQTIPSNRPQYFYAYIAAICRHLSLNLLDRKQAQKRSAEIVAITDELELCIPDESHDRAARGKEIAKAMDAFLSQLPKDSRLIFLRRYWFADSVSDIATRYAMTPSKVKMQLLRTRSKLKEYLAQEGIAV